VGEGTSFEFEVTADAGAWAFQMSMGLVWNGTFVTSILLVMHLSEWWAAL
jgi:hypothetical protein